MRERYRYRDKLNCTAVDDSTFAIHVYQSDALTTFSIIRFYKVILYTYIVNC